MYRRYLEGTLEVIIVLPKLVPDTMMQQRLQRVACFQLLSPVWLLKDRTRGEKNMNFTSQHKDALQKIKNTKCLQMH